MALLQRRCPHRRKNRPRRWGHRRYNSRGALFLSCTQQILVNLSFFTFQRLSFGLSGLRTVEHAGQIGLMQDFGFRLLIREGTAPGHPTCQLLSENVRMARAASETTLAGRRSPLQKPTFHLSKRGSPLVAGQRRRTALKAQRRGLPPRSRPQWASFNGWDAVPLDDHLAHSSTP